MTTGNKIMWKRGEIAPKEQFLLFSTLLYIYIFLTSGVKLHIHLLNVVLQFIDFLTLSTLICRGTNITKCFSESLGIRDNESRLYFLLYMINMNLSFFSVIVQTTEQASGFNLYQTVRTEIGFTYEIGIHVLFFTAFVDFSEVWFQCKFTLPFLLRRF